MLTPHVSYLDEATQIAMRLSREGENHAVKWETFRFTTSDSGAKNDLQHPKYTALISPEDCINEKQVGSRKWEETWLNDWIDKSDSSLHLLKQ